MPAYEPYWYEVFPVIGELLDAHYKNQKSAGRALFEKFDSDPEFKKLNPWIQKFKKDSKVWYLDPFHVFASITSNSTSVPTRVARLNIIMRLLGSVERYENIKYTGCPSPIAITLLSPRSPKSNLQIWELMHQVLNKGASVVSQKTFDAVSEWYGIELPTLTMFLFWLKPKEFIPLDKNTVTLLESVNIIKNTPTTYDAYWSIFPATRDDMFFIELARIAYLFVNGEKYYTDNNYVNTYLGNTSNLVERFMFKLVAIRPLETPGKTKAKLINNLQPGEFYTFYSFFSFANYNQDGSVIYEQEKDVDLYRINNVRVSISAIVGKNGSGKSTLNDVFFAIVNNLSYKIFGTKHDNLPEDDIYADLFFTADTLYRIKCQGRKVSVYRHRVTHEGYDFPAPINVGIDFLRRFFYTIAVNYSHYALNTNKIPWLAALFHKNDGYQVPLVLSPWRDKGNIDVNTENQLVNMRLGAIILNTVEDINDRKNPRYVKDTVYTSEIKLTFNAEKLNYVYDTEPISIIDKFRGHVLTRVFWIFEITPKSGKIYEAACTYIVKKLVKIAVKYERYLKYYSTEERKFLELDNYLLELKDYPSHITDKLMQAINFIKYNHISTTYEEDELLLNVEDLSLKIDTIKRENSSQQKLKTVELIPPPFFDTDIILSDGSQFSAMSSGEKQRIYAVSSVAYHLQNIGSVRQNENIVGYKCINIIFDEIELYYHPEMQRSFIDHLLKYLKKIELEINALNFCFITHSPFILSDILGSNTLFLDDGRPLVDKNIQTFGANIHDLLSHSFFLNNGFIGAFAKEKIEEVIRDLMLWKEKLNGDDNDVAKSEPKYKKERLLQVIELIGEPFIKAKLLDTYYDIWDKEYRIKQMQEEIRQLNEKIIQLHDQY